MTQDFEQLKQWIGQKKSDVDYVRIPAVHRPPVDCGKPSAEGKSAKLWVMDDQDALALSATAEFQ